MLGAWATRARRRAAKAELFARRTVRISHTPRWLPGRCSFGRSTRNAGARNCCKELECCGWQGPKMTTLNVDLCRYLGNTKSLTRNCRSAKWPGAGRKSTSKACDGESSSRTVGFCEPDMHVRLSRKGLWQKVASSWKPPCFRVDWRRAANTDCSFRMDRSC